MSSDETSGSDNRQRTVAELLAANGKEQPSSAPRRRRRRAEDTTEETAPQAIIDRVRSDSGTFRPVDPNSPPPAPPTSHSGAHRSGYHQPVAPEAPRHSPPPQQPTPRQDPPAARQAAPWPPPGGQQPHAAPTPPVRREPPRQASQQPLTPRPGALGARLSGKEPDPHTEEFTAVAGEWPEAPRGGEPPAGLGQSAGPTQAPQEDVTRSGAAQRASVANRLAGLRRPQKDGDSADGFDAFGAGTGTGITPAAPPQFPSPGGNGTGHGRPVGYPAEPYQDAPYQEGDYPDSGYDDENWGYAQTADEGFQQEEYRDGEERDGYEDSDYEDSDYEDADYEDADYEDEDAYEDADYDGEDAYEDADYDEGVYEDDEHAVAAEGSGSTREWLTLMGLVAASVVGGAAVWLAFDWFWGVLPAGALAGALVVIAAMVWIVRKFRHAEDMQTMVLSVVAGLVMTVSPAALLLLGR